MLCVEPGLKAPTCISFGKVIFKLSISHYKLNKDILKGVLLLVYNRLKYNERRVVRIRPIYEQYPTYVNTLILKPTVEGFTENLRLEGSSMENIVTNGTEVKKGEAQTLQYDIDTSKLEENTEYTIFLELTENNYAQGDFEKLKVSIGKPNGANVTSYMGMYDAVGKMHFNVETNDLSGVNKSDLKICFTHVDGQTGVMGPKVVEVKNVMLVKGHFTKDLDFFTGSTGLGPHVAIKTYNKNLIKYVEHGTLNTSDGADKKDPTNVYVRTDFIRVAGLGETFTFTPNIKSIPSAIRGSGVYEIFTYDKAKGFKRRVTGKNSITIQPDEVYIRCNVNTFKTSKTQKKLYNVCFQLEEGDTPTDYVKHEESIKDIILPKPLIENQYLVYEKDYNCMVCKKRVGAHDDPTKDITLYTTDLFDIDLKTFDESTLFKVSDLTEHGGAVVLGAIKFEYLKNPEYPHLDDPVWRKHHVILTLKSGDIIDTKFWGDVDESQYKNGIISLTNGYYGIQDKTILVKDIIKITKVF